MRDLLDCRDAIDAIDSEIISLLQQRQEVARDVARYKSISAARAKSSPP